MSYQDGWSAINLEMPPRVPHTEYSIERHWEVVRRVTGRQVDVHSSTEEQSRASAALIKNWNFDFLWNTLISGDVFGSFKTDMGHAEYEEAGVDRRDHIYCPFKTPEEVLAMDFFETYGTIDQAEWTRRFEEHYRKACLWAPDLVNMTGIYVTSISGLVEVFGWEMMLLAAGTDPAAFGALTNRYANWILQFYQALAAADVPVVMVHDDIVWTSGAILAPRFYRQFIFPNYRRYFQPLLDSGKKIMYTSDGDFTQFIDDIAACGVHGFVMEPCTDMAYIAQKYGKTHAFIGNADTRILLSGKKEDIRMEVERCMAIGKGCPGFFMAVGNHIPANTPPENVLYYMDIYEKMSKR